MSAVAARITGVAVGVTASMACGALAGGWWWAVGLAGAAACAGSVIDRQLGFVQVLAALALVAGVVAAGHQWSVVVLAVGPLASIELLAAADRTTIVRPTVPDVGRLLVAVPTLAALSATILVIGAVSAGVAAGGAVVAGVAAAVAIRVIAR